MKIDTIPMFSDEEVMALLNSIPREKAKVAPQASIGFVKNDGGRTREGLKIADCSVRALANAEQISYTEAEEYLAAFTDYRPYNRGVNTLRMRKLFADLGWKFVQHRMSLTKPSAKDALPERCILSFRVHVAWYAEGVIHDTFNPLQAKGFTQCNGYYVKE